MVTHLANHINTALTKIQLRQYADAGDDVSGLAPEHLHETPDWNFYEGEMGNTAHHYSENEVDLLFNTEIDR
jgi:hypothetical protein